MVTKAEREKLTRQASAAVRKAYGEGSSERAIKVLAYPSLWASTGSLALDRAIAGQVPGGVPMGPRSGRVIHVFGDPSLGKSVLVDQLVLSVQRIDGYSLISETEGSRDPHFADALGVDLGQVEIQPAPDTIEQLFDMGLEYHDKIREKDPATPFFWGVDSLELIEAGRTWGVKMSGKESGVYQYGGGRAGAIGAALRKVAHACASYPTSVLVLNQVREKPGVMFGDPKQPTGGKSPRFLASVEVKLTSSELGIVHGVGRAVGRWVHARVVKNKVANPFSECDFYIDFARGLRPWAGVAEGLAKEGVIAIEKTKKGQFAGKEFTVVKTGEVLPTAEFVAWCKRSGALGPRGKDGA